MDAQREHICKSWDISANLACSRKRKEAGEADDQGLSDFQQGRKTNRARLRGPHRRLDFIQSHWKGSSIGLEEADAGDGG